MGKRKDGDFGSISVYEGNIGTWMGSGPQRQETAVVDLVVDQPMGAPGIGTQSEQTALSAEEATKAVRSVVLPMVENNKQCRKFLDGMLSELERTRLSPIKRNFLSVFNTLSEQVGFVDLSGLVDDYGQTTLIGGNLSIGINFSKAEPTGPFALEINAVHEVFHAAARGDLYGEFDMAEAAYVVGTRMGIVPPLVKAPKKTETLANRTYNTRLINQIIFNACKPR